MVDACSLEIDIVPEGCHEYCQLHPTPNDWSTRPCAPNSTPSALPISRANTLKETSHLLHIIMSTTPATSSESDRGRKLIIENLKAIEVLPKLTPEILAEIDEILQNKPAPLVRNSLAHKFTHQLTPAIPSLRSASLPSTRTVLSLPTSTKLA